MLIVLGKAVFRNPVSDDVRAKLAELAKEVRQRHAGNVDYRFSFDSEDGRTLRLTERWDALESFVQHGTTPEVAAIGALINPASTESIEVTRYEAMSEARVV